MTRTLRSLTKAQPQPGSGILHPFPTGQLAHIDPFVFLDTGTPMNLGERNIYVGPHAHRGVQPVSLLFRGRIEHRDSLGNHRTVTSGGIQWLVAGAGALHEEVLGGDEDGVFHMAQLWVNVPAALKMAVPEHHAVGAEHVPEITDLGAGCRLRLYAGKIGEETGPAPLPTPVLVAHVQLEPEAKVEIPIAANWNAAFTVVAGSVALDDAASLEPGDTPVFNHDGETVALSSKNGGEVLLMCGLPIDEPIAMGAGFVMNTQSEIQTAISDYQQGKMGTLHASR